MKREPVVASSSKRPLILGGGLLVVFAALIAYQPSYDTNDLNYTPLVQQFQRLVDINGNASANLRSQLDLSQLNGGQWAKACLFGPYTSPVSMIIRERVLLAPTDYLRFVGLIAHYPFRLAVVEESEAMLIYDDLQGLTHVLHFERGLPDHPHWSGCILKPETIMVL